MARLAERILKSAALRLVALWRHNRVAFSVPVDLNQMSRVLIFRPEKIGDMVLALPLVDALKRANPALRVDALVSEQGGPVLAGDPRFERVHLYRRGAGSDLAQAFRLHRGKYDMIVDLIGSDSYTGAMTVLLISNPGTLKVSVGKNKLSAYYDQNFPIYPDRHMKESTMQPLELFGVTWTNEDLLAPPYRSPEALKAAATFVRSLKLPTGKKPIGINMSAGVRNRQWSKENVAALLALLVREMPDEKFVVIAGPEDYATGKRLAEAAGPEVAIIPEGMTLGAVCAIIGELGLLVGPDTSLPHIARSLRVPVVGLYLPFNEDFKRWGPLMQEHGMLIARNDSAIDEITPEMVLAEIRVVMTGAR
ncbi:MAG: glycosyltransferase family 9 protein [Candidatus Zixiibacteriota bacterium]